MFKRFSVFLFLFLFFSLPFSSWAKQDYKIVLVHSYDCDDVCGGPQREGILEAINHSSFSQKVKIFDFYMNTKTKNTSKDSIINVSKKAIRFIKKINPQVVVCFDDNAFLYVGLNFLNDKNISIVFSGLNGLPEDYNQIFNFMNNRQKPGKNVTGVYEKLYVEKSINLFKHILPKFNKLIVITDPTTTGKALLKQVSLESKSIKDVDVKFIEVDNFRDYKEIITQINSKKLADVIYPLALSLQVSKDKVAGPKEVFRWTLKHSNIPDIAVNYYFCKLGLLGGATVDFKEMGKQAGEKVLKILKGTFAGDIPIDDARAYALAFNVERAKMLNLDIPKNILFASDKIYKKVELIQDAK